MKTVKLSLDTAISLYKEGGASKQFALDNYTEKELNTDLFKCIDTLSDVYEKLGRRMPFASDYTFLPSHAVEKALNRQYLDDIAELFNGDSKFNRYYNCFEKTTQGWRFYYSLDYSCFFNSYVGFCDYKTAQFVGEKFLDIYIKTLE